MKVSSTDHQGPKNNCLTTHGNYRISMLYKHICVLYTWLNSNLKKFSPGQETMLFDAQTVIHAEAGCLLFGLDPA